MRVGNSALVFFVLITVSPLQLAAQSYFQEQFAIKHDESPPLRDLPGPLPANTDVSEVEQPAFPAFDDDYTVSSETEDTDPVLQFSALSALGSTDTLNIGGLGLGFVGPQGTFSVTRVPPDTNGAIGAFQYIQQVNESFAVFSKATGAVLDGPRGTGSVWLRFRDGM